MEPVRDDDRHAAYNVLYERLSGPCRGAAPGHGFRFKNRLMCLDATYMDLCLEVFPWAKYRKSKGAIKIHVGLDQCRQSAVVRESDRREGVGHRVARALRLPPDSIVAADRLCQGFGWLKSLDEQGVLFVTRLKRDVRYAVRERRSFAAGTGVELPRFRGQSTFRESSSFLVGLLEVDG